MDDSLLKLSISSDMRALESSVTGPSLGKPFGQQNRTGGAKNSSSDNSRQYQSIHHKYHHHHHHNHSYHHYHCHHNHNNRHNHHNCFLESSSLSKSLHKSRRRRFNSVSLGHRTHKRFEYHIQSIQVLIFLIFISLITEFSCINYVKCLDSPVKVQRSKQQKQQQQQIRQQQPSLGNSKESVPQLFLNQQIAEDSIQQNNARSLNVSIARYERVRRTDSTNNEKSHRQKQVQDEQCPSNKLSQSLLPPEYIGSPAASQRQHMSRAYCDCTVDLYGWHLTCFAGSASQQRANVNFNLPNQLHPAFRGPQLQRQQQQAAAAASSLPNGRRIYRRSTSGSRWMGDSIDTENNPQPLTSEMVDKTKNNIELADPNSNSSAHEGFGEETYPTAAAAANHHQANSATITPMNKLRVRTTNLRSNFTPNSQEATIEANEDGLMSLASSNSFALLQLQDSEQQQQVSRTAQQQQQERPIINHSSASSSHITFQTVPVLFSVKYIRNNMIEIDCDQAAPHYKPAMFQGFNVNDIDSFTFNNCQLPNIPFSVLLHRTRPSSSLPLPAAPTSQSAAGQNNSSLDMASSHQSPAAAAAADPAAAVSGSTVQGTQFLKPNRQRHQNLVRKRRDPSSSNSDNSFDEYELEASRDGDDLLAASSSLNGDIASFLPNSDSSSSGNQDEPSVAAHLDQSHTRTQTQTQSRPNFESKIKKLTVNLNTVVDQRTLISLLTGLDLLEDLQLNYMQLNLTNFEPDLEADPTSSATISAVDMDMNSSRNTQNQAPPIEISRQTTSTMNSAISAPSQNQHQQSPSTPLNHNGNSNHHPATGSSSLSLPQTTTSTSTTTMATPAAQFLSLPGSSSQQISTNSVIANARSNASPTTGTSRIATIASTISIPQTATPPAPMTTTSTTTTALQSTTIPSSSPTNKPVSSSSSQSAPVSTRNKLQQNSLNRSTVPPVSSSVTRSSISLGAPRGLMIAQATGVPPTQSSQTTTPSPSLSTTTVPSIPLSTVISSTQQNNLRSSLSSQQSTSSTVHHQPTNTVPAAGTRNSPVLDHTAPTHGSLISVGSSQSQSVSYTSNTDAVANSVSGNSNSNSQPHQTKPQTVPSLFNTNQPSSSFSNVSNPISSSSQQLPQNRLHSTPSAWFQSGGSSLNQITPAAIAPQTLLRTSASPSSASLTSPVNPPAGTRLTMNNNQGGQDSMIQAGQDQQQPASSASSWSTTVPIMSSTPSTLNGPINAPPFLGSQTSPIHSHGFGIRTSSSSAPLPVSLGLFNGGSNSGFRPASLASSHSVGLRGLNSNSNSNSNTNNNHFTTTAMSTGNGQSSMNTPNHHHDQINNNLFQHQSRRQQQATTNNNNQQQSTPPTSTLVDTSTHFIAAGGRLSQSAAQHRRHQISQGSSNRATGPYAPANENNNILASSNIAPETSNDPFNSHSAFNALSDDFDPTPTFRARRMRRNAASSSGSTFEEFELSFGELLPNLRSLKLESFIDLSHVVNKDKNIDNNVNNRKPIQMLNSQRRFKRQFQPSDIPEKDEGHMSDSESDAISSSGNFETLLAEETNVHHNSVMASGVSSSTKLRVSVMPRSSNNSTLQHNKKIKASNVESSHLETVVGDQNDGDEDLDTDQEPGEILMRSASNDAEDMRDSAAHNGDWSLPASSSSSSFPSPSSSSSLTDPLKDEESDQFFNSNSAKLRHFSLILVKLFSKLNKLRVLQLNSNDIPYWPDNVLYDSRNSLARLYLISNNIRLLGKNSLANLTELETLDLSSNQLRQLNGDSFRDLSSLKNLRACRNLFRKLPSKLFSQIHQHQINYKTNTSTASMRPAANRLESVDFSKNRYLSQLSADMFALPTRHSSSLSPIKSLNLSDCVFTDQLAGKSPEILFASLPDLISVSLQHNKLRELLATSGLFAKNNKLQKLDLSHNQIAILNNNLFNANASQITDLQLHHNQLTQIPEQFLFNLKKLKRISLAHNNIKQLNTSMFFTNQLIEFIDLSHNQLITLNTHKSSSLPFGNGVNLKFLNLAHNNLSQFEGDIFDISWQFYTNLHLLDLSHNRFSSQISMPIFYTIADEMLLNLASNQIQSVSVDALMQHEQTLDRFASSEPDNFGSVGSTKQERIKNSQQQQAKLPTVNIKLTSNPIACDCLLEPLISYSRRIAAATNPSLLASIFPPKSSNSIHQDNHPHNQNNNQDTNLPASSRYSVLNANDQVAALAASEASKQPQLFYQFKFNDLYCAKPNNLQRRLLSHISIGDLLCPIKDQKLCPRQCQCHYQSAFKTAIVDCNNRQLAHIPEQLTDSTNFMNFNVESAISPSSRDDSSTNEQLSNISISSVDKVIIRLDNNNLKSIERLSKLFSVIQSSPSLSTGQSAELSANTLIEPRNRFARAPSRLFGGTAPTSFEPNIEPLNRASAQPLIASEVFSSSSVAPQQALSGKKVISPVIIGRNMRGIPSSPPTGSNNRQQRNRRASSSSPRDSQDEPGNIFDTLNSGGKVLGSDSGGGADLVGTTIDSIPELQPSNDNSLSGATSTAVLESAEEFRNKRYPLTCELYLDHNIINLIPESFLEALDQVKSSSMKSSIIPPQAALPTLMLEPPIHTKLNNVGSLSDPQLDAIRGNNGTASSTILPDSSSMNNEDINEDSKLFGRHSLAPEKKAALFETINQNVRASQLKKQDVRQQQQQQVKVSVSPSLVVLSLRYNNLSNVNSKMLHRLSKLIKSSNTKLYLGHNPFNCSNNLISPEMNNDIDGEDKPEILPVSPMGDQLIATSDATSGTYLENADDLSPSASSADPSTASGLFSNQLVPSDCPIGQLKTWLTRHHLSIGDLDELYCVHMPSDLIEKLRLSSNSTSQLDVPSERLKLSSANPNSNSNNKWEHDHPWASSLMLSSELSNEARSNNNNATHISKNGFTWNSEVLASTARLIDVNMYDLCPYSGNQLLDASASGLLSPVHQQVLVSVAIIFILISLCLLLMLVYFGDTQTILAFIYIHMNPIYSCLRLNESHLDGEKLYDAFVSYSSADRDIVLELIEKLEQQESASGGAVNKGYSNHSASEQSGAIGDLRRIGQSKASKLMDRSHDTLVTEADLRPDLGQNNNNNINENNNGNNTLNRRTNSFQDLSTMSRSTSRVMMGSDGYGGSAMDMMNNNSASNGTLGKSHMTNERDLPYRLCIHERDWLPGHLISWNIVNSVQNSRRTILILSKDFIKSVWFQVEFHTAYYQMLEDKIDRLIVIVRGELPPKNELDKNLAFLLTTKTYLTWGEKWFWERLHYALPHRSAPPTVSKSKILQQQPIRQHHHHYVPKSIGNSNNNKNNDTSKNKSSDLAVSLSNSASTQKPLIMSSIGKDCSNLLLPVHNNQAPIGSSSSSASTSSSNTRSSSSFLSGTSTGNLLSPTGAPIMNTVTTNNDLLSTTTSSAGVNRDNKTNSTTRVTIGASGGDHHHQQAKVNQDSGCVTTINTSSSILTDSGKTSGVTNIIVDNNQQQQHIKLQSSANSKVRAKKQERLQSFVDQKISDHFNLSEL